MVKVRYQWKVLEDGLLKDLDDLSSRETGDSIDLNQYYCVEEAEVDLDGAYNMFPSLKSFDFVLVKIYSKV